MLRSQNFFIAPKSIADVYSNVLSVMAVLIFWFVMIISFYSRERLEKIIEFIACKVCWKKKEDLEEEEEVKSATTIEMRNINILHNKK